LRRSLYPKFNAYYGPEAACVIPKFFKTYLRMYKVPGDALERYVDMLERMQNVGILHADLHSGNFVYDANSQQLHPFDFSNQRQRFFDADVQTKETLNLVDTLQWSKTWARIRSIKAESPERTGKLEE